jgi:hypothetical protein
VGLIVPFNGDTFIGPEIRKLIQRFKIKTIIETGTWSGHTTREFARMGPEVITIDSTLEHLLEEFGNNAVADLQKKASLHLGDSSKDLAGIIKLALPPILFYLDAHGGGANNSNVNPIKEELDQIFLGTEDMTEKPVIAIHDFFVPGKNFGYNGGDWGNGFEPLSYDLLRDRLYPIYPDGFDYHYNDKANGATRGVIYVYPK